VLTIPVWAIGAMVVLAKKPDPTAGWVIEPLGTGGAHGRGVGRCAVVAAVLALAVWPFVLPYTQSEQRLRHRVERELRAGRVAAALETMSAHVQEDFPPHWDPPPRPAYREPGPPLLDVLEAVADRVESGRPTPEWVGRAYAEKFERAFLSGYFLRYRDPSDTHTLQRVERLLHRLPEGPSLALKYEEELRDARRQTDSATAADNGSATRPAATGPAGSPVFDPLE
jgi:hypothetical protein